MEQSELLIKLDDFEGPLDLLLHLIKETKMDIQEVPMILIVDQYLAFIHAMPTVQLDIAGEYLVMAATLLEIKSRLLLPRVDKADLDDEDQVDLQEDLIQQLIEYKQFKDIAELLRDKEQERGQLFSKSPSELEHLQEQVPLKEGEVNLDDMIKAFQKMFQKQAAKQPVQAKIEMSTISVEDAMVSIMDKVRLTKEGIAIEEFVDSKETLIATFLAMLELARSKRIYFKQPNNRAQIYIYQGERASEETLDLTEVTSGI